MASTARISLVVFDLGGVVVRIASSWEEAHSLAGLAPDTMPRSPGFEDARIGALDALQRGGLIPARYYQRVAAASGGAYRPADVERIHHAWTRDEYRGFDRIFDVLEDSGVATAILSNTNEPHWRRLMAVGDPAPEYTTPIRATYRFASHELALLKPEPSIFAAVVTATGVPPAEVLFFDDVAEYVAGAREAGWNAHLVNRDEEPAAQVLRVLHRHGLADAAV